MRELNMANTIATMIAVPKPSMTKFAPNNVEVINNITALMTKRKSPNDMTVIGNVKRTKIGFTMEFTIVNIKPAKIAVPIPAT